MGTPSVGGPSADSGAPTGEPDAGSLADATSSCHASDVQTYVPSGTYQAAADPSDACLGAPGDPPLYETFYDDCLGPNKSKASCSLFEQAAASAACASCVLTPFTAMRLGPILDYGGFVGGNVPGCIEVTESPPGNLMCASAVQALSDCELAACQANCPVSDSASLAAREQCATMADATGCQSYSAAVSPACSAVSPDGGALQTVCTDTVFKDFYDAVVPLFCASSPIDGGAAEDAVAPASDAGADAGGSASDRDAAPADAGVIVVDAARD